MQPLFQQKPRKYGSRDQGAGSPGTNNLLHILNRFLDLLNDLGDDFAAARDRLQTLRERLLTERFHLAVLGQFKRSKSTLINALIGEPLLPTSVLPLTSIPTFLSPGPKRLIRVSFHDGHSEELSDLSSNRAAEMLAKYVTEERNPANKLAVSWVEAEHPSALEGVIVIDTPGIGSTFRHNTEATLAFLPQCDAALFVVSPDPPLTDVEVDFLKAVQTKVSRLFFVMNKIDYLGVEDLDRAVDFFRKVVGELGRLDGEPVFRVSARQGLQAKLNHDEALWRLSGLPELETRLLNFLSREKAHTLQLALARKTLDLVADAMMRIRLECRSLQMPLEDLERRIRMLDEKIKEAERERITIGDLLAGERKRTVEFLESQAEEARKRGRSQLEGLIDDAVQTVKSTRAMEQRAQERLAEEIPVFFERELRSLFEAMDRRVQEALRPYQKRADDLIENVRRTATDLFEIPYHATDSTGALERAHKPYWVTHNWNTLISPIPEGFFDQFLPSSFRYRRIRKRLAEDVETLVVYNVENVRWAMLRNLDDAFRRFGSTLDERLKETIEATRGAVRSAHLRRNENLDRVESELQRLKAKESELTEIDKALAKFTAVPGAKND